MNIKKIWDIAKIVARFSKEEASEFKVAYKLEREQYLLEQHLSKLSSSQIERLAHILEELTKKPEEVDG